MIALRTANHFITGEPVDFQADAADEVRLRQVAHLRARLERR